MARNFYPDVRAALDTELTEANLPDSMIAMSIFHEAAIADVNRRYPAAATETDPDNLARIHRATVLYCAARLAPSVVRLTSVSVQTRDASYSKQAFDPESRAKELRALADAELDSILSPDEWPRNRPVYFSLATGNRGR